MRGTIDSLLDGAMDQFTRHGYAKTTMSDIAAAAEVSRTSLYKHFPTKDDVFRALSDRINRQVHEDVAAALLVEGDWDDRLIRLFNARVAWVYRLLHDSEYGRELINEKNRICGGSVMAANDRFFQLIVPMLREKAGSDDRADRLARALVNSVNGILDGAATREEAEKQVSLIVGAVCAGMSDASTSRE